MMAIRNGMLVAALFCLAFAFSGCGDSSSGSAADKCPNGCAVDEGDCKDGCDTVGGCWSQFNTDACYDQCEQMNVFSFETLTCLDNAAGSCDKVSKCMETP